MSSPLVSGTMSLAVTSVLAASITTYLYCTSPKTAAPKAKVLPNPMDIAKANSEASSTPKPISASVVHVKVAIAATPSATAPKPVKSCPTKDEEHDNHTEKAMECIGDSYLSLITLIDVPLDSIQPNESASGIDFKSNSETLTPETIQTTNGSAGADALLIGEKPEPSPQDIEKNVDLIKEYIKTQSEFYKTIEKEVDEWDTDIRKCRLDLQRSVKLHLVDLETLERGKRILARIDKQKDQEIIEMRYTTNPGVKIYLYSNAKFNEINQTRVSAQKKQIPDIYKISVYERLLKHRIENIVSYGGAKMIVQSKAELQIKMDQKSKTQPTILLSTLEKILNLKKAKLKWWSEQIKFLDKDTALKSAAVKTEKTNGDAKASGNT